MAADYGKKGFKELLEESINTINSRKKSMYIIHYECNHNKTISDFVELDNICSTCDKIKSIIRIDKIHKDKIETIHNYGDSQGSV